MVQTGSGNKNKDNKNNKQDNVQPPKVEEDRESLEEIADLIKDVVPGAGSSLTDEVVSKLDDVSLSELITNLLENTGKVPAGDSALDVIPDEDAPDMDVGEKEEHYDENGAMEIPFDQMYPDVVVQEQVQFDKETLLIKMYNSYGGAISAGMKAAGVAALEPIVPMETATWYEAKLLMGTNIAEAVEALRALGEILMVDYNYQVETAAMAQYEALPEGWADNTQVTEQWYLNYCGIPSGTGELSVPGGSSSVVVAVIDTGVDYNHEDLADNIWVNTGETPDNGVDDDGNGYIDDYYGVDIVAGKGSGNDDHGHGTHVAGIIAAKNNNLGVVGIAHNVKIMPVKAAMASGYLNQSDIAKAILYAYEHGAEVINMSFGGSACSIAVQDALEVAYTRCVLVASAGNDGMPDEKRIPSLPNYPAALSYVLGVMSVNQSGVESGFSNWDAELYSPYEYELYAPGEAILSTIPGNRYASWSGTSMAAPVVAAMAALLRSEYSDRNTYPTKFIYGQLVATSENYGICCNPIDHGPHNLPPIANLYQAVTVMPKPDVGLQDYALFDTEGMAQDTAGVNSGEGVIDAGETIALGLTLRNRWGMSKDTIVKIDTLSDGGVADPYITIHNPEVNYGSVGTYSTGNCGAIYTDGLLTAWENPFYITISEDCPNDYIFRLNVTVTCGNGLDAEDEEQYVNTDSIELMVRNGYVLPQYIEEDMVLTSNNLYIIPTATVIQEGVTVRVEPGTHIQFWSNEADDPYADSYIAYLQVRGRFLVEGTAENPVYIYPSDLMWDYAVDIFEEDTGYISLEYADVTNLYTSANTYHGRKDAIHVSYADHCTFRGIGVRSYVRYVADTTVKRAEQGRNKVNFGLAKDCIFYKMYMEPWGNFERCLFADSPIYGEFFAYQDSMFATFRRCVFLGNNLDTRDHGGYIYNETSSVELSTLFLENLQEKGFATFYRPETGTTYLRVNFDTTYGRDGQYDVITEYIRLMGADYAAFETAEELNWFTASQSQMSAYGYFGIRYDADLDCFTWANGVPVGDFVPGAETLANMTPKTEVAMYTNNGKLSELGNSGAYPYYEFPGDVLPTEITFREYEVLMDPEMTYLIYPKTQPAQVSSEILIFESTNTNVVTVDANGLVTPVGLGTADVYVYSQDRAVWNYVSFEVKDYVALEDISFDVDTVEVPVGQTYTAEPTLYPADTTRRSMTYTSSDSSVATVNEFGVITGIASGEAQITASCGDVSEMISVVVYTPITSLEVKQVAMAGVIDGDPFVLPEVLLSEGEPSLYWYAYDENVARVEPDGTVTLVAEGMTTLKVEDLRTGFSDTVDLYVSQTALPKAVKISADEYGDKACVLLENGTLVTTDGKTTQVLGTDIVDLTADMTVTEL